MPPQPDVHHPQGTGKLGYHWIFQVGFLLVAVLAGGAALAALWLSFQPTLETAIVELERDPSQVGLGSTLALLVVVVAPLSVGAVGYFIAWQSVRLMHLSRYLRRLHAYAGDALRQHAYLTRFGYVERGLPFLADGRPASVDEQPLLNILIRSRTTLLLGEDGIGKTTVMRQCAYELTRKRLLLPIAFGQAPLPILVPLAAYADAPREEHQVRLHYLASQIKTFGHARLASRLLTAFDRWNVMLLCDGLDEVPDHERAAVAAELGALASDKRRSAHLVVTCALSPYMSDAARFMGLNEIPRVVATGLNADDIQRIIKQAHHAHHGRRETLDDLSNNMLGGGLGAQIAHPATLSAYLDLRASGVQPPSGRGLLLHEYATLLCQRAAGRDLDPRHIAELLSALALSMRDADLAAIPIPPGTSIGQAIATLLAEALLFGPRDASAGLPHFDDPATIERIATAAAGVGLLEWSPDRRWVKFAQRSLESTFAARALEVAYGDTGEIPPFLVAPQWQEPLLLWAGRTARPGVALRLLALANTFDTAESDIPADYGSDTTTRRQFVVALALAALLEALAPGIAPATTQQASNDELEVMQEHLRDLVDRIEEMEETPDERSRFSEILATIERDAQVDLGAHLAHIAESTRVRRLVRAQVIVLLGHFTSPSALDALMALLPDSDPVIRQAIDRAFATASLSALTRLQDALRSGDERIRMRTMEAMTSAGAAAVASARQGLDAPDPKQRAASAQALGALRATGETQRLLKRMDDSDLLVRVAATWALGQIGSPDVVPALEAHLSNAAPEVRAAVAEALGSIRTASSATALLPLLQDSDARVRAAAAESLGKLGDERAVTSLRDRLLDRDPWAQAAAATALRRLGSPQ